MQTVAGYFGQQGDRCGACDNCLKEAKKARPTAPDQLRKMVLEALQAPATARELAQRLPGHDKQALVDAARQLLAENLLEKLEDGRVLAKKKSG